MLRSVANFVCLICNFVLFILIISLCDIPFLIPCFALNLENHNIIQSSGCVVAIENLTVLLQMCPRVLTLLALPCMLFVIKFADPSLRSILCTLILFISFHKKECSKLYLRGRKYFYFNIYPHYFIPAHLP